jgi:two-component system, LytTR family, response regulator
MYPVKKEYTCFIVDDNAIDRLTTVSFVRNYSFIKISGLFDNAAAALEGAEQSSPDAILLDIDMPEISGLDLRLKLDRVPACIFITAYPDYALPAFEVNALDFLVKPLSPDRFDLSMNRLRHFLDIHFRGAPIEHEVAEEQLFIKDGHEHIKIGLTDILYLEALKDYTGIITREKKYCVLTPLGNLLKENSFQSFIRIHRSYAVAKQRIHKVSAREVHVEGIALPVGRTYKEALDQLLSR